MHLARQIVVRGNHATNQGTLKVSRESYDDKMKCKLVDIEPVRCCTGGEGKNMQKMQAVPVKGHLTKH